MLKVFSFCNDDYFEINLTTLQPKSESYSYQNYLSLKSYHLMTGFLCINLYRIENCTRTLIRFSDFNILIKHFSRKYKRIDTLVNWNLKFPIGLA